MVFYITKIKHFTDCHDWLCFWWQRSFKLKFAILNKNRYSRINFTVAKSQQSSHVTRIPRISNIQQTLGYSVTRMPSQETAPKAESRKSGKQAGNKAAKNAKTTKDGEYSIHNVFCYQLIKVLPIKCQSSFSFIWVQPHFYEESLIMTVVQKKIISGVATTVCRKSRRLGYLLITNVNDTTAGLSKWSQVYEGVTPLSSN